MQIITLKSAIEKGLPRYFTGKPCKRGHLSERYVKGYHCVECGKERSKEWIKNNPEKRSASLREYVERNKAAVTAKNNRWWKNNPHKYDEYRAKQTPEQKARKAKRMKEWR